MPLLDFKEIPMANSATGKQDTFELFARDVLSLLNFEIISGPDRGVDFGRDLIVKERRNGIFTNSEIRWLVSCKHFAHSGNSVTDSAETDISDRVTKHQCNAFLGFYSTVVSSTLRNKIENMHYESYILDHELLENLLLSHHDGGYDIIKRYFPKSFNNLNDNKPSNVLGKYFPLSCEHCGNDLLKEYLTEKANGVLVLISDRPTSSKETRIYTDMYWVCKGKCDDLLESRYPKNSRFGWQDLDDLLIPSYYLNWLITIMKKQKDRSVGFTDGAFKTLTEFITITSQITLKNLNRRALARLTQLNELPFI